MIATDFAYSAPATLADALQLIADGAKPLAGGMSLVPMMKLRLAQPERLVDLRRIPGLKGVREEDGRLRIGALTTHYEMASSALVRLKCPLLSETAGHIGDVQVRNMGTIGGSLAHADPAADWPAAILASEATLVVESVGGRREITASDFFLDPFATAIEPGELLVEIVVSPDAEGARSAYRKMVQPASGFAIVGVAARVEKTGGGVTKCRIGVTGVAGVPFRALGVEQRLVGTAGSKADVAAAVKGLAADVEANSDIHASALYRKAMAEVYAARALESIL
ncbi:MAG: xanthine dehydrogenase family protein subunit M [Bryobacterales bacterium]|nr:xanthine dehydrogenase family protein subunit M [Bryobacterales bacterium]